MNSVSATLRPTVIAAFILCGMKVVFVAAQPARTPADSMRGCAECHLQWMETFDQPRAVLLIERPEEPVEAQAETCLSCHDGSTVDSRRRVWLEHGHKTGVAPPPSMKIPESLPLKDGKIACRTCHTAHGTQAGAETQVNVVQMRMPNEKSQMCLMCHVDYDKTPAQGGHSIKGISEPIPVSLIEAGARTAPDTKEIHCQVCHTPHGAREEHLLVMGSAENQLCLSCHGQQRPGMWHEKGPGLHPDRPVIHSAEQLEAISQMKTQLGRENRLICLSCHRMHDGKSSRFLLAMELKDSKFCIQCHQDQAILFDTRHDLRKVANDARNLLGFTVEQAGPCSACHMFHHLAIEPQPGGADPSGMCVNCHSDKGVAGRTGAQKGDMTNSHPLNIRVTKIAAQTPLPLFTYQPDEGQVLACQTCHDPHSSRQKGFLRDAAGNLCRQCHADLARNLIDSPHDPHNNSNKWDVSMDFENRCYVCHKTHTWDEDGNLWTFALADNQAPSDAVCIGCHQNIRWAGVEQPELKHVIHPREISGFFSSEAPLAHEASDPQMICKTCHDPHACAESKAMLRGCDIKQPAEICNGCHEQAKSLDFSMHSRRIMEHNFAQDKLICGPCHAVHATETSSKGMLWAAVQDSAEQIPSERRCLGCHGPQGRSRRPNIVRHPEPELMEGAAAQWSKAVLGDDKAVNRITCLLCHVPHGRIIEDSNKPGLTKEMTPGQLGATKPMLRPDVAGQFCTKCHGFEALPYFLYYHRPEKR